MKKIARRITRWFWTKNIEPDGYYKLRIYRTPLGTFWTLRWGYWMTGFCQFFSMGKFYVRSRKRFKL